MHTELKNKIVTGTMLVFFGGLSLCCWLKPAAAYSDSERRSLKQRPEASAKQLLSGNFMTEFEAYSLDQFPFRDGFRNIKALTASGLMRQLDNNGIYVEDGYISQMEYPLDSASVEHAAQRFRFVYEQYLEESNARVYLSIVPDKNYFLAEKSGHLSMDYEALVQTMQSSMDYAQYLDIWDLLSLEDYYKTDTHWRQECITDVAERLGKAMGAELTGEYERKQLDQPFYGVYYGQAALPLSPEPLYYLTSEPLLGCRVYDYEHDKRIGIYDEEKGQGRDPYELFLSGSLSLIEIENPAAATEKELILFRDSFGSSLAPLLAEGYRRITLVDIRYIQPEFLGRYLEFRDQDVLFLYSTLVLNHSETIR